MQDPEPAAPSYDRAPLLLGAPLRVQLYEPKTAYGRFGEDEKIRCFRVDCDCEVCHAAAAEGKGKGRYAYRDLANPATLKVQEFRGVFYVSARRVRMGSSSNLKNAVTRNGVTLTVVSLLRMLRVPAICQRDGAPWDEQDPLIPTYLLPFYVRVAAKCPLVDLYRTEEGVPAMGLSAYGRRELLAINPSWPLPPLQAPPQPPREEGELLFAIEQLNSAHDEAQDQRQIVVEWIDAGTRFARDPIVRFARAMSEAARGQDPLNLVASPYFETMYKAQREVRRAMKRRLSEIAQTLDKERVELGHCLDQMKRAHQRMREVLERAPDNELGELPRKRQRQRAE